MDHTFLEKLTKESLSRLLIFASVGTTGFLIEVSMILVLTVFAHLTPIIAKFIALPFTVLSTWLLNRHLTFPEYAKSKIRSELVRYLQTATLAISLNLTIYFIIISTSNTSILTIICATALGALTGLIASYYGCIKFVFQRAENVNQK
jgi:putative flippase GtrA